MVHVKKLYRTASGRIFKNMSEFAKAAEYDEGTKPADIIEDYLQSWGLEMYTSKFKEHGINFETLLMLTEDNIKELVPMIGHRAKLIKQLSTVKNVQSKDLTIQQYYDEFKALNQQGGIFLLLKDYKSVYPDCDQKLVENWLTVRGKIIDLAKKRNDTMLKDILKDTDHASDEIMDITAFMAIPLLMTTTNVSKTKSKNLTAYGGHRNKRCKKGLLPM